MSFWILAVVISGLVAALVVIAMGRARRGATASGFDMQVYRDQLKEVDRDVARGVISNDDAERVRTEVSRRLLDADRNAVAPDDQTLPANSQYLAPGALGLALILAAFGMYAQLGARNYADLPLQTRLENARDLLANRPSQQEIQDQFSAVQIDPSADPRMLDLMEKLRTALADRPDDLQGHILLARNEALLGDFVAAHRAQARVIAIKDANAVASDYADYADILILAAGGYVSPKAEAALRAALQRDAKNGTARYYTGLMFAQNDRPDLAFRLWRALLNESGAGDPWVDPIRAQIEIVAAEAGERYSLPTATTQRGPDADDIAAAAQMSGEDRQVFIASMVERLSTRLADEGGPAQDWAQLITALGVLGETQRATAIWNEAQQVFGAQPDALGTVRAAAERAGITQ